MGIRAPSLYKHVGSLADLRKRVVPETENCEPTLGDVLDDRAGSPNI